MDHKLEDVIHAAYQLKTTLVLDNPPPRIKKALNVVRGVLKRHPPPEQGAHLFVEKDKDGYWFPLKDSVNIGRHYTNDIVVESLYVSLTQCHIEKINGDGWLLKDEVSINGVYVNNRKVNQHYLKDGDIIQIAHKLFIFISNADLSCNSV